MLEAVRAGQKCSNMHSQAAVVRACVRPASTTCITRDGMCQNIPVLFLPVGSCSSCKLCRACIANHNNSYATCQSFTSATWKQLRFTVAALGNFGPRCAEHMGRGTQNTACPIHQVCEHALIAGELRQVQLRPGARRPFAPPQVIVASHHRGAAALHARRGRTDASGAQRRK